MSSDTPGDRPPASQPSSTAPAAVEPQTVIVESATLPIVEELVTAFQRGEHAKLTDLLDRLGAASDSDLYRRVGEMTRTLHESLREFQRTIDPGSVSMHSTNISDAATKLENVIKQTFEAASKTFELTERQNALIKEQEDRSLALQTLLADSAKTAAEKEAAVHQYLNEQAELREALKSISRDLLMSQAFQDLTGQALKKVIRLVTELEKNLVNLVSVFGDSHHAAPEASQEDEKLAQGDVDSILSSFGF